MAAVTTSEIKSEHEGPLAREEVPNEPVDG